ncbi:CDF family Co(II)/Ni(II) efflux transporter DmeF [Sphingopyxis macrogoltabida]|uniref:Cation transporter n=1 Tax=Sphingopyxis macrogoltabida TaxID=33050 RepID=A0AAC9FFW8_SPHMC|nr:CDF family Co(II)/Ni(II) efflux transporter DmeF [Sphingopyxis macrogoltabida]ALJ14491.1 cation transporter [Sphingopyxis macrogoltabida]AMU90753.1 cation transporter [Sphingopyxis macrogoltabida]
MSTTESAATQPLHDFLGSAHDENAKRTLWVVALTAVMMVGEIAAGYWTGSMALLADGFHMATHAGALGLAALAYRYAKRHRHDPRFSFGTGKVGDLTAFASAVILGIFSVGIAFESILRLVDPVRVDFASATLVAVLGLAVNIVSALLLMGGHHHGHDHGHDHGDDHGHHHDHSHGHDNNLRSAYFHVLADALTSVLAIAALLAGRYLGLGWMDPAMGIVGALVIARWSWGLMRDTAAILLDETDDRLAAELRNRIAAIDGLRVADLHVWRVGPEARAAIVEVEGALSAAELRARLGDLGSIAHLTIAVR